MKSYITKTVTIIEGRFRGADEKIPLSDDVAQKYLSAGVIEPVEKVSAGADTEADEAPAKRSRKPKDTGTEA